MPSTYDHTHNTNGAFIHLGQTQDVEGEHCAHCGRSIYPDTQPHNHKATCPDYRPHPGSIAAQAK